MASRIEQIIDELEEYLDNCKTQAFSQNKIIVNREEVEGYISELRLKTPEEIERYKKIITNKDAILDDAKTKADQLLDETRTRANELLTEHEITQKAYAQANDIIEEASAKAQEIIEQANRESAEMRHGAIEYSNAMLENVEMVIGQALEEYTQRYNGLLSSLQDSYNTVRSNRSELNMTNR